MSMNQRYTAVEPVLPTMAASVSDEERMRALIETLSAYIEHYHHGAVEMVQFDGETLRVRLLGACVGCRLSETTVHGWVEGTVRPFFPNLKTVQAV
jgi:Fe-S cluster biogenesis protein NfuA